MSYVRTTIIIIQFSGTITTGRNVHMIHIHTAKKRGGAGFVKKNGKLCVKKKEFI